MSTLSQNERQALNDIFTAITEKETFFSKLKESKSEIKHFFKLLIMRNRKRLKHPIR
ncbi:hypothetical protein [Sulfurospirillum halorespirans]|uniref:Uncharacterized protein n=1 Tax=Sulfurospirillum halorespirans DSM 13726 TaxID=1193502 RepID=A0A1D7TKH0_9BACT|nr:hypothetical protein [Sulfurospirillum halorespirans]AOO65487.1 hypothetical protein SHALO_1716 [Sulfurospirillum halorespirans DSM 13726]